MPYWIGGAVFLVGIASLAAVLLFVALLYLSIDRVPEGVYAAGVDIGGMAVDDAEAALRDASAVLANQPVTLVDGDRQWSASFGELGVALNVEAMLAAVQAASPNTTLAPQYSIDFTAMQDQLIALSGQINIPATTTSGRALDIPAVLDRVWRDPVGELADGRIDLIMIALEPAPVEASAPLYTGPTTIHIVEPGQELGLIAREYGVSIADIVQLNNIANPDLLFIGQELVIPAAGPYQPPPEMVPPAPRATGRSIVVSVSQQRIFAYENGQLVRSHLVSTGLPDTPTVLGDFAVYVKHVATDMRGPDYFLPQVPYTMYFHRGYGIHGTYWHNSFGRPMSHGCVNLPVDEAQWFFEFADVGTPVRVIA